MILGNLHDEDHKHNSYYVETLIFYFSSLRRKKKQWYWSNM